MKVLLVCGVHVDQRTAGGETALLTAARRAHMEAVQLLLEHGANVNLRSEEQHRSTLQWVVGHAQTDMVQLLLHAGAEVRTHTTQAHSPPIGLPNYARRSTATAGLPRRCGSAWRAETPQQGTQTMKAKQTMKPRGGFCLRDSELVGVS
jgi:hypothetical protein